MLLTPWRQECRSHLKSSHNYHVEIINISSVSVITKLRAGQLEFDSRHEFIFPATNSRPILELIRPPMKCILGTIYPEVKRPGRQTNRSPPSRFVVINACSYTYTPLYIHGVVFN